MSGGATNITPGANWLSIAQITTATASTVDDVALYRAAGVPGIGVWEYKLAADEDPEEAAELVRSSGLAVSTLVPVGNSVYPNPFDPEPTDPWRRVDALIERLPAFAALRPECVLIITGVPVSSSPPSMSDCAAHLRRLADAASKLDVRIGLEAIHTEAPGFSMVSTLAECRALLRRVDHPSLGMVVDTWHLRDDPGTLAQLRQGASDVIAVQLSDVRPHQYSWADRGLPGEGTLRLEQFMAALDDGDYAGAIEVEIFSDDGRWGTLVPGSLWQLAPGELVSRVVETSTRFVSH